MVKAMNILRVLSGYISLEARLNVT